MKKLMERVEKINRQMEHPVLFTGAVFSNLLAGREVLIYW
jgi:hypothetical protein